MGDNALLTGLDKLINPQNIRPGVNYEEIARSLSVGSKVKKEDISTETKNELDDLARKLDLSFATPRETPRAYRSPAQPARDESTPMYQSPGATPIHRSPYQNNAGSTPAYNSAALPPQSRYGTPIDEELPEEQPFADFDYTQQSPKQPTPIRRPRTEFQQLTEEDERHRQVEEVVNSMSKSGNNYMSLEKARRDDEKITLLDDIDLLWKSIEQDDARLLHGMEKPTLQDDYETIFNIHKRLQMKNDRNKFSGIADEGILMLAQFAGTVFDGKKVYFGKYSPDLVGWEEEVRVKNRRYKHDTSTIVGNFFRKYNLGSGLRILLELIPNAIIFSNRKKNNRGKSGIASDMDISSAFNNIRNLTE